MRKIKVQVFAADPLSSGVGGSAGRLMLDEEVRRMRATVRAADFGNAVEFDVHWATRPGDLLQAMNEVTAEVVHFSGHGGTSGLVLVAENRQPCPVDAEALARLFSAFPAGIRVVVLNACLSLPQAQAIAGVVGCAIGTSGEISDEAAVTFAGAFYRGIAFGRSVGAAFDQARAELGMSHPGEAGLPRLVSRPGVDPARLVLIPGGSAEAEGLSSSPRRASPRRRVSTSILLRGSGVLALGAAAFAYASVPWAPQPVQAVPSSAAGAGQAPRQDSTTARQPVPAPPARSETKSAAASPRTEAATRPPPSGNRDEPDAAPRRPPPADPEPEALAFASEALAQARAEFSRGEYLPARRRMAMAAERLDVLEQRYPDSQPVRALQKQIASLLLDVRTACEADARIRNVEAECT
jgi:hypothetical protein